MYNNVQDNLFEGLLTAALNEFVAEELAAAPSDEELAKEYPISQKMLKYYRRKAKEKNLKSPLALVYLKRAAVILLITVSVAFGILMTSEDVRAAIVETFITWYEDYIKFDFSKTKTPVDTDKPIDTDETVDPITEIANMEFTYIPSGFELIQAIEDIGSRDYIYMKEDGCNLVVGVCLSDGSSFAVNNNEDMDYEILSINGKEMYVSYNEVEKAGNIVYGNKDYMVTISGVLPKEEMIKVVEGIK